MKVFIFILFLLVILLVCLSPILYFAFFLLLLFGTLCFIYFIYEHAYYKSKKFLYIKETVSDYVSECNELNAHIEELKNSNLKFHRIDYGNATYTDNSRFAFKRPELNNITTNSSTYECSLTVCKNAQQQPFKYVCKYFNIAVNEETLIKAEKMFNDFSAVEQGKLLLDAKSDKIIYDNINRIPLLIRKFRKKHFLKKLNLNTIDFSKTYFPKYTFLYVSAGGNSSMRCDVVFDLINLEKFITYLSQEISSKNEVIKQRSLMTAKLREAIKKRDNYTCQHCGISVRDEPHLLLEIDHIIPISKNGVTTEDNLQTLCWKCNRSKGSKIY